MMPGNEFETARQATIDETTGIAVARKITDRMQRRAVLDRLRPTVDDDLRARAEAAVAHFRTGADDATA